MGTCASLSVGYNSQLSGRSGALHRAARFLPVVDEPSCARAAGIFVEAGDLVEIKYHFTPAISEKMFFPFFQISLNSLFIGITAETSNLIVASGIFQLKHR